MSARDWLVRWGHGWYLALLVAGDHPDQVAPRSAVRWHDLLWLLIPIVGFVVFIGRIDDRDLA